MGTRPPAGTATSWWSPPRSRAPVTLASTVTVPGLPVSLTTSTPPLASSPTLRKRGIAPSSCNGLRTVMRLSPDPKRSPASAATAIKRYAVRLSGAWKVTFARPSASVSMRAFQYAVDMNRDRNVPGAPAPSPPVA
jgi:hypothetical protein